VYSRLNRGFDNGKHGLRICSTGGLGCHVRGPRLSCSGPTEGDQKNNAGQSKIWRSFFLRQHHRSRCYRARRKPVTTALPSLRAATAAGALVRGSSSDEVMESAIIGLPDQCSLTGHGWDATLFTCKDRGNALLRWCNGCKGKTRSRKIRRV
jgi:hypothetical protein